MRRGHDQANELENVVAIQFLLSLEELGQRSSLLFLELVLQKALLECGDEPLVVAEVFPGDLGEPLGPPGLLATPRAARRRQVGRASAVVGAPGAPG